MARAAQHLRARLLRLAQRHSVFRRLLRRTAHLLFTLRYRLRGVSAPVEEKTIFFCAFNGKLYCDSPRAIYEYCLQAPEFSDYRFIWMLRDAQGAPQLQANPRTEVVTNSAAYEKALRRVKYWVLNYHVQDYIYPRRNQIYLQCWHGTPLKRLAFDLEKFSNAMNSKDEMCLKYWQDAKKITYLLSPSPYASEKFISSFALDRLGKQAAIRETGYPRNDILHTCSPEDMLRIKKALGLARDGRKVLLYAPTWRDDQYDAAIGYTQQNERVFESLYEALHEDYVLLFRSHPFIGTTLDVTQYAGFVKDVTHWSDIAQLFLVADMLITDYSSVFFDYANTKRPILFYMYDLEHYRDELRGFYLSLDMLPGPVIRDETTLIAQIIRYGEDFQPDERYKEFCKTYNPLDDGEAARRAAQLLI